MYASHHDPQAQTRQLVAWQVCKPQLPAWERRRGWVEVWPLGKKLTPKYKKTPEGQTEPSALASVSGGDHRHPWVISACTTPHTLKRLQKGEPPAIQGALPDSTSTVWGQAGLELHQLSLWDTSGHRPVGHRRTRATAIQAGTGFNIYTSRIQGSNSFKNKIKHKPKDTQQRKKTVYFSFSHQYLTFLKAS